MKAVDSETMAIVEHQYMQENKIHSKELMFTAGIGVAREILSYLASFIFDNHIKRFVFLVGKGNNGGDGCVVAQYLSENTNIPIVCYHICDVDHMSEETAFYFLKLSKNITTEQKEFLNSNNFKYGDIIIDCLLGTGYKGEIKEPYKNWIESANSSNNPIIALDIPSGLNSSTGEVVSSAIEADITLSIGLPKKGFFINDGLKHVGKIEIVDIGIHQVSQDKHMADSLEVFTSIEARTLCTRVGNCVNKRSMGTVLVIGGCINYNGAPFLAGQAALSSGAGLVTVAVPNSLLIKNIAKTESLSLITHGISDSNSGFFTEESIPQLKELAQKHSTIVLGPGFGSYPDSKFVVEFLLGLGKRTVIDADALNLISNNPEIITQNSNYVFTPHQGELERLLNAFNIEISTDRIINVNNLLKNLKGTVVLKGNKSIIACPEKMLFNSSGSSSLATAGTGDVLSGIIGAMLCNSKISTLDATALSVFIHGKAGEIAEKRVGVRGSTADDILECIPPAMKLISPFA